MIPLMVGVVNIIAMRVALVTVMIVLIRRM